MNDNLIIITLLHIGGLMWQKSSAPSGNWYSVTSSSNGLLVNAVINGGNIYHSTSGKTLFQVVYII